MIGPVAIYLALNAGQPSAHGWGTAMSTDTAFALGALALVGRRLPDRVRTYLLTFSVVDDVAGIAVIAIVYSGRVRLVPLLAGVGFLALAALARFRRVRYGPVYAALGTAAWVAVFSSGIDPVVVGLVLGLLAYARPATRDDLAQATDLFRLFREQPTAELAQAAQAGVRTVISPNDRLQQIFHPWSSYVVVPLFALANAGVTVSGGFLARAFSAPVTLGILLGYLVGKPAGTVGAAWLVTRLSRGRIRPPIGWAAVTGAGAIAGVGFTVSLLIASLAFRGAELQEAKIGVLSAALCASAATWIVFRLTAMLPKRLKIRALIGTADVITDLAVPVDPRRDHVRGPADAPVTMVEYSDFECPYCGLAEPVVRELLADFGDVRYVWRHLPLHDVHPHAQFAAEATEAAAAQGAFWPMHDLLLAHQGALTGRDLARIRRAARPGHRAVHGRHAPPCRGGPRGRGRGLRRSVRGVRDAHVLRQRHAPPRRVRHRFAVGRGARRAGPRLSRRPRRPPGPGPAGARRAAAGRQRGLAALLRLVLVEDVHGGLLGPGRPGVDPDVAGDEILLRVRVRSLVLGHQPARAGIGEVLLLQQVVLGVGFLVFPLRLGVRVDVGDLLGQMLVQGFTGLFLGLGRPELVGRQPAVRREDPGVERIAGGAVLQRIRRILLIVVVDLGPDRHVVYLVETGGVIRLVVGHVGCFLLRAGALPSDTPGYTRAGSLIPQPCTTVPPRASVIRPLFPGRPQSMCADPYRRPDLGQ